MIWLKGVVEVCTGCGMIQLGFHMHTTCACRRWSKTIGCEMKVRYKMEFRFARSNGIDGLNSGQNAGICVCVLRWMAARSELIWVEIRV